MSPVITSTDGRCVAEYQMDPAGARLLRQARDQLLDLLARDHHEVGELVDHHHQQRQRLEILGVVGSERERVLERLLLLDALAHLLVVGGEVAHRERAHELVAPLHLGHAPVQRGARLAHVGDDRGEQVRDALVDRELEHLGVDHDQPHLARESPCRAATGSSR
jgi:hypothetical protein